MAKDIITGRLLAGLRRKKLSYKQFGDLIGVGKSQVFKKLNGQMTLSVVDAQDWARKLGVKISCKLK